MGARVMTDNRQSTTNTVLYDTTINHTYDILGDNFTSNLSPSLLHLYATNMTTRSKTKTKTNTQDDEDDTAATMAAVVSPIAQEKIMLAREALLIDLKENPQ